MKTCICFHLAQMRSITRRALRPCALLLCEVGLVGALNACGGGAGSTPAPVYPPGAPTLGKVSVGTQDPSSAVVEFLAPISDGGTPITSYRATCSSSTGAAAQATGDASARSLTVAGLTIGATYTCAVSAQNAAGEGPPSQASAPFMTSIAWVLIDEKYAGVGATNDSSQQWQNLFTFAALKSDGSVVGWGPDQRGAVAGCATPVNTCTAAPLDALGSGVAQIFSNREAFAALKTDGSVVTWGRSLNGGDSTAVSAGLGGGVVRIFSSGFAFAALKSDGSVLTWGNPAYGGSATAVASSLRSGVTDIFSTEGAFAALKSDGSLVTWGDAVKGGDSSSVADSLAGGVDQVFPSVNAFAALKSDGSLVVWGDPTRGGDASAVANQLTGGVAKVHAGFSAFAALKSDGSVVTWGAPASGGDSSSVASGLGQGVVRIFSSRGAFAALKQDGSVLTWGDPAYAGDTTCQGGTLPDCTPVSAGALSSGVTQIFSNRHAFVALKSDGSVVTWGTTAKGGDSSGVGEQLQGGVAQVFDNQLAFAALMTNGSVVTWGDAATGGDTTCANGTVSNCTPAPTGSLSGDVIQIAQTYNAFAALKSDGSVIAWGNPSMGADSSAVAAQLKSGVVTIASPLYYPVLRSVSK